MSELLCPTCGARYSSEHEFCSLDGARLRMATEEADAQLGLVLDGRYRLEGAIGQGASGTVYRARQLSVDRHVAIKVMHSERARDPQKIRRFEAEARTLSKLRHPNSLALIDFGHTDEGHPFIVSPLLEGASLRDVLRDEGTLEVERLIAILRQVCEALEEAHGLGLVHRDLKPENIFLERHGEREVVRVIDYGIALALEDEERLTEDGKTIGTIDYMSPEQIRGDPLDDRSDVYTLGVVAYECLRGSPPFSGSSRSSVMLQHLQDEPVALDELRPELPGLLVDAIMRALEKFPEHRFENARDFRHALGGHTATNTSPVVLRVEPERSGHWVWMLGAFAMVLVAATAWALTRPAPPAAVDAALPQAAPAEAADAAPKRVDAAVAKAVDAAPPKAVDATLPPDARPPKARRRPPPRRPAPLPDAAAPKPKKPDATLPPPGLY